MALVKKDKLFVKKELPKPVIIKYDMRKAGDSSFYIVSIDKNGNSSGLYIDGGLVSFDTFPEAKEYLTEINKGGN